MKRRDVLVGLVGTVPLSGCSVSLNRNESGNVQVDNDTGQEVWMEISVQTEGGFFSRSETVYERRIRQPPTERFRSTLTDVARPGTHQVQVTFESRETEQASGEHTTQWSPSGEKSEALIIVLTSDFDVEFLTQ